MNRSRNLCKSHRRRGRIVLVVTLATALLVVATAATGCGSAKAKGVHGTSIAYVKVPSSRQTLHQGQRMTAIIKIDAAPSAQITHKTAVTFVVGVKNDGDYTEHNVKVTLRIEQTPNPIKKTKTIGQMYKGTITEVAFKGVSGFTDLINKVPIKVDVAPVPGETNLANNSATYSVRFTL